MEQNTTNLTFLKVFEAFPYEKFKQIVAVAECDRYIKKSKTLKLLYLMIIAQFLGFESLHDIAGKVVSDKHLQKVLHLTSISASTLSRRLRQIDHHVWEETFCAVRHNTWQGINKGDSGQYRLNIIDASTISLCLSRFLWADFRQTKGGIKLHQRILVHDDGSIYPDHAVLTTARRADKTMLDELIVMADDVLNVFDRGYVDYTKWDDYCRKGVRFVSRLKSNATINVIEEQTVALDQGLTDRIVLLGKPSVNQMIHPVRLIETRDKDGDLVIIVTNDLTLSVLEISDVYRRRWQIELFFKWIKQHFTVKQFFGTSPNAVYGQIWIALIGYCLLQHLRQKLPPKYTLLDVLRAVRTFLYRAFSELLAVLSRGPTKKSRGRRTSVADEYDQLVAQIGRHGTHALDAVSEGMYL